MEYLGQVSTDNSQPVDESFLDKLKTEPLKKLIKALLKANYSDPVTLEGEFPVKELTQDDLADTPFGTYSPDFWFYVQGVKVFKDMEPESVHCHVYFTGEIIITSRCWKYSRSGRYRYRKGSIWKNGHSLNKMTVRTWSVKACEHDDECTSSRNCFHSYRCKKCGFEHSIDSSD